MGLALMWLCQGLFVLCALQAARIGVSRWATAVRYVTMFPGANAVGAWLALQALPVSLAALVLGCLSLPLGLTTFGAILITSGCLTIFTAACGITLLMPNLGVERHRSFESQ